MRLPEQFTNRDWLFYIKEAVARETGIEWKPPRGAEGTWCRKTKLLTQQEDMPALLVALGIDVAAVNWNATLAVSPWEALSYGHLVYLFRNKPRSYWRAVWFSRFARGGDVHRYTYWLTQFDVTLSMVEGEPGRDDLLQRTRDALRKLETKMIKEDLKPVFEINWLREVIVD
jgi:hypothetical protein